MSYSTRTDDFEIELQVDGITLAEFGSANGVEGSVGEPDIPYKRLHSSQLLELAKFFIEAAKERAADEFRDLEREL